MVQVLEKQDSKVEVFTLKCLTNTCGLHTRIGRIIGIPIFDLNQLKYCPVCGGKAVACKDSVQDYWESLSKEFGLPPDLMVAIHHTWNSLEQPNFKQHVRDTISEALKDGANN